MTELKEQSLRLWQNINKKQRYLILGAGVILFLAIIGWSYWLGNKTEYVPLFTNMEAKDAGEVAAKLKEMKVAYEIGDKGSAILVPSKDVYRVRLDLAAQGLPRGKKGFELFEQSKFGTTDFQNKVNLIQALQGELARTIEQMEEVEQARVHIVLPEDSLYKKNEKPATASIMIKLKPTAQLSQNQVKGIVNLVAHSIQNLKPENITVVDSNAKVLNDPNAQDETQQKNITLLQWQMTKKLQDELQNNIQSLLDQVLGNGKAAARVTLELNFDQRSVNKQLYEPVVDDKGIIRSSQETSEAYKGTSNPPVGGPAGTTSNIPGYVTTNTNNGQSSYEKKEVTRNYEINETQEKIISAPGSIKRLSVAVFVDSNLTQAQQDSIQKVVASAAGFNQARGDSISVERVPFNTELLDKQKQEEQNQLEQQKIINFIKIALAVLAVIAVVIGFRAYARRKEQEEEQNMISLMTPMPVAAAQESEPEVQETPKPKEPSPQEKERQQQRDAIGKLAKTKPEDIAQLIRTWIGDE